MRCTVAPKGNEDADSSFVEKWMICLVFGSGTLEHVCYGVDECLLLQLGDFCIDELDSIHNRSVKPSPRCVVVALTLCVAVR